MKTIALAQCCRVDLRIALGALDPRLIGTQRYALAERDGRRAEGLMWEHVHFAGSYALENYGREDSETHIVR
jgi:hypothetical protein